MAVGGPRRFRLRKRPPYWRARPKKWPKPENGWNVSSAWRPGRLTSVRCSAASARNYGSGTRTQTRLPTEIKELLDEFFEHLQAATPEQPLILFLDALDQLADSDNGRLLNWLSPASLPAHVKLVVSCLSDRATGDPAGQPYAELKSRQVPGRELHQLGRSLGG